MNESENMTYRVVLAIVFYLAFAEMASATDSQINASATFIRRQPRTKKEIKIHNFHKTEEHASYKASKFPYKYVCKRTLNPKIKDCERILKTY